MWNSKELKEKGRNAMKANYGMTIVVSLIMTFLAGASSTYTGSNGARSFGGVIKESKLAPEQVKVIIAAILSVVLIIIAIGFVLKVALINPLNVGCYNFFIKNTEEPADFSELKRAFKPNWTNNVITMFLTDLFLGLWFCLLIIPGFVKMYSYRLVPYILAENPDMKAMEVITFSRQLMKGNKWKAFCFDLSFIGWTLLSLITCGFVGLLYVNPYYNCSCAELYKTLRYGSGETEKV